MEGLLYNLRFQKGIKMQPVEMSVEEVCRGGGSRFSCLYRWKHRKQNKLPARCYPAELMRDSCMQSGILTIAVAAGLFSAN